MIALLVSSAIFAQEKLKIKFGKISPADFVLPDSPLLKDASAVVLADIGFTDFVGNNKSSFSLVFTRHVRIKINNANGIDAAEFVIPMYFDGDQEEKVESLKGVTYNLEAGKVVETPLKSSIVFEEKQDKNHRLKKFSMPGVKAGSVIDVSYTITSDFIFNLQPWVFQGQYPCLWSEYEVGIPEFFNYVFLAQGYHPYHLKTTDGKFTDFKVTHNGGSEANVTQTVPGRVFISRWVMKNIPPLKEEPFTSSLRNHISKIEFQLNRVAFPNQLPKNYMGSWADVVRQRNESEYFGANLYKANNWLDDDIKKVVGNSTDTLERVVKIYEYVRDNFTCTQNVGTSLQEDGLRGVMKRKNGNVAELNLLLTAMLNHEKLSAFPVLLSTRSHGFTHDLYPLMNRFNYTVCVLLLGDQEYFLDASERGLGFGKLPSRCYNGHARVMTGEGIPIVLTADMLKESKATTFNMLQTDAGNWEGFLNTTLGYYGSMQAREEVRDNGKDAFFKSLQKQLPHGFVIDESSFGNLDKKEESLVVNWGMKIEPGDEDIIYLNPMVGEGYEENPFKSAERYYPVEMPFAQEEVFVATIDIPKGYKVDEMPKSARVMLNEDDGSFEYIIARQEGKIMLRSRLVLKKANFQPEDYQSLRDFFGFIVKKHSEQIVFKKG